MTSRWPRRAAREILIVLAFAALTALVTWPYVTRLRDAVVDPGDPYLISWIMWWDYHATFNDPLNLFHANIFYPYRYALAFSEHSYGLAFPFFPLYALGARPLTVHAVAMFAGFALCGYGAFRLARTLTGSAGAAWVAGIIFAFIPYRFHLMSQVAYLFSLWVPLLFEALVLFVRERSRRRAAWLGAAFFMSGLTCLSWFVLSLVPFALSAAILLTRHGLWRERALWRRGAAALAAAALALLPFTWPYYAASKLYGFERTVAEVRANSAWPIHWLSVEGRNRLWGGMGESLPDGHKFKLFPGLLPLLLSLAAVLLVRPQTPRPPSDDGGRALPNDEAPPASALESPSRSPVEPLSTGGDYPRERWIRMLDIFTTVALAASLLAVGFEGTGRFGGLFGHVTSERALALFTLAAVARLCLAYPAFLRRGGGANLVETLRSARRTDAFWLGAAWAVVGFCYSLGWNFFFYRILYDMLPLFRSMRVATRGAMFAYLGLAVLAGVGAVRLAGLIRQRRPRVRSSAVYAVVCALLLFELNAAPLKFLRGEVYPDAVTLRLKETEMRGGVVVLPAGNEFNHRHVLRAADHAKPLVNGISGFKTPYATEIEFYTRGDGPVHAQFLDLLEAIPASYLVVETHLLTNERRVAYEAFLARTLAAGRLRFVNRFDGRADLYAVVKTEPEAKSEAPPPSGVVLREWAAAIAEDPLNLLAQSRRWTHAIYRLYVAAAGRMPRYEEFTADVRALGTGVMMGADEQDERLAQNLRALAEDWTRRADFVARHGAAGEARYVAALLSNAGLQPEEAERAALVRSLEDGTETRAGLLLKVVADERFARREENRAQVLLHFFAYLRRDPDDPPDGDMRGFKHWVTELDRHGDVAGLTGAFANSIEHKEVIARARR